MVISPNLDGLICPIGNQLFTSWNFVYNNYTQTIDNSAAYVQGWLSKLNNDKRLVVQAGAMGQKAADYILGNENGNRSYN